ncbi:MAG: dephospho-CoA kinase [Rubrivivax sp.]|nr:dephospho-CoA kinase [Rubrivivax sp.]
MDRLDLNPPLRAIGLTGGIGSGKSTVARSLVACGAHLVDTDAIARELTAPGGAAMPALAAAFGAGVVASDGALDRNCMRQLAFADAGTKARLEAILHPLIGQEAHRQAAAAAARPVVFDVPLLVESSPWRTRVQRVLVVDCSEATQIARVALRPGWTEDLARRVVAQQATRAARRAVADAVIFNEGLSLQALDAEVRALWSAWVGTTVAPV